MKNFLRSFVALCYLLTATSAPAGFVINSYVYAAPTAFAYLNSYALTNNASSFNHTSADLGPNGTNKLVIVAVNAPNNNAVTAMTIDGQTATVRATSGAASRLAEIWAATGVTSTSGTIAITYAGTQNASQIHVYVGYPASSTVVDGDGNNNSVSALGLLNLAKTDLGFTICTSKRNDTSAVAWTQSGPETIIEDNDSVLEAANAVSAMHHLNTATSTTDDYLATFTGSTGSGLACATWGPP